LNQNAAADPPPWLAFVNEWKSLSMSRLRSEQAIREELLGPMLRMLGYGGRTVNEVLYNHPEPLPEEYRMVGSTRMEVDYIPTLRLHRFWIVEAKKPGGLNPKAFLQAHFYATYPTINARYIVLGDGEQLRLYDARATNFEEARVIVQRDRAEHDFGALYELLAARNIIDAIRRDVLRDAERVLSAEIDVNAPRVFASEVAAITLRVQPLIAENVRQLMLADFDKKTAERRAYLRSADMRALLAVMAYPGEIPPDTSNELARRLTEGTEQERRAVFQAAMDAVARPARQTLRCSVLRGVLLGARDCTTSDRADFLAFGIALARSNLSYAAETPSINAALHLENAVDRVSMKIVQRVLRESAARAERLARQMMTVEELIVDPPSETFPLLTHAAGLAANLWSSLQAPDAETVLKRVRGIEQFEREHLPEQMPHLSGDFTMLGEKGAQLDLMIRATVDALNQIATSAPGLLPDDLAEIGAGWATSTFPPAPAVPDGEIDIETKVAFQVMYQALELMRDASAGQAVDEALNNVNGTDQP
jgi:hypothetical protein